MPRDNTVVMEDVKIIFRNFQGKEGPYNREGERSFGVLLDPQVAEDMAADGWNVKFLKPREDEEDDGSPPQAWLSVKAAYGKGRPPKVVQITSRGKTVLTEDTVEAIDFADIQTVDLIVRPYEWSVQGKTGISAYLQSMFVTIEEDALEQKYADMDAQ